MTTAQNWHEAERCTGRSRRLTGASLILVWASLLLLALGQGLEAAPYRPADDGEILEELPAGARDDKTTAPLRQALASNPNDLGLALRLARAEYRRGRDESDPRYLGYAEAALAPWWDLPAPPTEVLVLRALLRQRRHDFPGALDDLERALAAAPNHAQAWLTRASILRVLGRHDEAAASCRRLPRQVPLLIAASCQSAVRSLTGDAAASARRLRSALDRVADSQAAVTGAAGRVWALTLLGEIALQQGAPRRAETHFRAGLALAPRDGYLLAALADLLLAQGRAEAVLVLLDGQTGNAPRNDALLLRLALAEAALGGDREAAFRRDLAARFAASARRGDSGHGREQARFTLDLLARPDAALTLALENWQQQKEPADARLVLRAALAAKRPAAAGPVLAWIDATGLRDAQSDALANDLKGLTTP